MAVELRECQVDLEARRVQRGDAVHELTAVEAKALQALVAHRGEDVSTEVLYRTVWGTEAPVDPLALRQVVVRLRRKIETDPKHPQNLLTVRGGGYHLAALSQPAAPIRRDPPLPIRSGLALDLAGQAVIRAGSSAPLTALEVRILETLLKAGGVVVGREDLYRSAWGHTAQLETRALDKAIHRLREKLEDDPKEPSVLVTERGIGFRMALEVAGGNVPADPDPFVGREPELGAIADALGRARLVTLVGPGGIGKTRLATRAAQQWAGTAWFLDLVSSRTAEDVRAAVAASLGIPGSGSAALRSKGVSLLVLDNLEQVDEAGRAVIAGWLTDVPALRVLATSRERLRLKGEIPYEVPPLDLASAEQLFVERRRARVPDWAPLDGERALLPQICGRLEGLPLAIELAAGRAAYFDLQAILSRIDDPLTFLVGGPIDGTRHHHTLRAAIARSWELVDPTEREAFQRVAVFEGTFSLDDARAVLPPAIDVERTLESLVDHSLVRFVAGRFRMLESLRAFGVEMLVESGTEDEARARHVERFIALAKVTDDQTSGHQADRDNLLAAVRHTLRKETPEDTARLLPALSGFAQNRGPHSLVIEACDLVLASEVEGSTRAYAHRYRMRANGELGRFVDAREDARRSAEGFQALGDERAATALLSQLGSYCVETGLVSEGMRHLREAAERTRAFAEPGTIASVFHSLADGARILGDLDEAELWSERAAHHYGLAAHWKSAIGHQAAVLTSQGAVAYLRSDFDRAHATLTRAMEVHRAEGRFRWILGTSYWMARVQVASDSADLAFRTLDGVLTELGDVEAFHETEVVRAELAEIQRVLGQALEARDRIERPIERARARGARLDLARMLGIRAGVEADLGNLERGRGALEEALDLLGDQLGPNADLTKFLTAVSARYPRA